MERFNMILDEQLFVLSLVAQYNQIMKLRGIK